MKSFWYPPQNRYIRIKERNKTRSAWYKTDPHLHIKFTARALYKVISPYIHLHIQ